MHFLRGSAIGVIALSGVAWGIEEPSYELLKKYDDFEVRQYAPYLIAETTVTGSFDEAGNRAFGLLAGYIQGENVRAEEIEMTAPVNQQPADPEGEQIEMTAPVIQAPSDDGENTYILSFVMPSEYTLDTLPKPRNEKVHIRQIDGKRMAVRMYGGNWSRERYVSNEKKLLEAVKAAGYEPIGSPIFARYNPPFMPSLLRRNEVMVEILPTDSP